MGLNVVVRPPPFLWGDSLRNLYVYRRRAGKKRKHRSFTPVYNAIRGRIFRPFPTFPLAVLATFYG